MSFDSLPPIDEIQINHYFNLARNVCYCSDFMKACLGTVLIHKDKVMSISREQVEKVWRGCDFCKIELDDYPYIVAHSDYSSSDTCYEPSFCPICGKPLTDEAVQMVMERLEELRDGSTTD